MPRVSIPPYPIAGGVDDLDEDTPPIVSQFPGKWWVQQSVGMGFEITACHVPLGITHFEICDKNFIQSFLFFSFIVTNLSAYYLRMLCEVHMHAYRHIFLYILTYIQK